MLLVVQAIVLLITETEAIVLKIEQWRRIRGTKDRTTALANEVTNEHIILYALDNQHHIALNTLTLLVGEFGPFGIVDKILNRLLEGVEDGLVATLNLVRIDGNRTFDLLRTHMRECAHEGQEKEQR